MGEALSRSLAISPPVDHSGPVVTDKLASPRTSLRSPSSSSRSTSAGDASSPLAPLEEDHVWSPLPSVPTFPIFSDELFSALREQAPASPSGAAVGEAKPRDDAQESASACAVASRTGGATPESCEPYAFFDTSAVTMCLRVPGSLDPLEVVDAWTIPLSSSSTVGDV